MIKNYGAIYALDIETDNTEGNGLDPHRAQIISIALVGNNGTVWYQEARTPEGERQMLCDFDQWFSTGKNGSLLVTWNGGAFDWPFLTRRFRLHGLVPPWKLHLRSDRQPKYEPLPGFDGTYRVEFLSLTDHIDIAYVYDKDWCEANSVKWSLKPVANHLGFRDVRLEAMSGEGASGEASHMLAAYNIHDSLMTRNLLLWASGFDHTDSSFNLDSLLD